VATPVLIRTTNKENMKFKKLPTLHIHNPFSCSPQIKLKINKFLLGLKIFVVTVVIALFASGAYVVNVQHEQKNILDQKVLFEKNKAPEGTGIVVDTTAIIIARDGKLPLDIAKKYAVWVYESSAKYGIDPILALSVMSVESGFNYKAISPTGPIGLFQIAASWHKDKTTQSALFDPRHNINVGVQILKEYSDKSNTDIETLLRYNGSLGTAPVYATKVLSFKRKYENEIDKAIVSSI
jgi:hypothetical protein